MQTDPISSENPEFWASRYQQNQTPWDLGQAAPPFVSLLSGRTLEPGKMAVVGCGHGHDAGFFGQQNFDVTGFDYAVEAVQSATARYGEWARFVHANIFNLDRRFDEQFDYVLEHTCFCAIPPSQREPYVQAVFHLLKPKGTYIGLFWAHSEPDGPPYKTDREEIISLFSPYFEIAELFPALNSVESRKPEELLGLFYRKEIPSKD